MGYLPDHRDLGTINPFMAERTNSLAEEELETHRRRAFAVRQAVSLRYAQAPRSARTQNESLDVPRGAVPAGSGHQRSQGTRGQVLTEVPR